MASQTNVKYLDCNVTTKYKELDRQHNYLWQLFKAGKTAMFKCEHITDDALTDRVYCIHATVPTVRLMASLYQ